VPNFVSGRAASAAAAAPGLSSMRARYWAIAVVGTILVRLATFDLTQAAEAYSAEAVKAEFLYRFAGYVEWPDELPGDAPFTIAVAADNGVVNELRQLLPGRTVQNHRVEIRQVSDVAGLLHAQMLYVPMRAPQLARSLLAAAAGRPILIVTDEVGGLTRGGIVNFVQLDRHVRFEISLTAAERSKLKINSGLLSVAAYVEGVRPRADANCWPTFTFGLTRSCVLRPAFAANGGWAGRHLRALAQILAPAS
jgi:hypothetical protein